MRTILTTGLTSLLLLATGCSQGRATASLAMRNATGSGTASRLAAAAGPSAPMAGDATFVAFSRLDLKLVAVYLAEDVDPQTQDNIGQTAMIYLNPECAGDISGCGPASTYAHQVTTFFDFAQPSAAVNAALNAQQNAIEPATYRYARMEFCKYGPGEEPNLRWQVPGMSAPATGLFNTCGVTSQPFATPLTLKDGDTVVVELAYDLSQAAMVGTAGGSPATLVDAAGVPHFFMTCVEEAGHRACLQVPEFVPAVAR